jgi:hypothetical protein
LARRARRIDLASLNLRRIGRRFKLPARPLSCSRWQETVVCVSMQAVAPGFNNRSTGRASLSRVNIPADVCRNTRNTNVRSNENGYRTPASKSERRAERRSQRAQARRNFPRERGAAGRPHRIVRSVSGHAEFSRGHPGGLQAFDFDYPGRHRQAVYRWNRAYRCRRVSGRRFEASCRDLA